MESNSTGRVTRAIIIMSSTVKTVVKQWCYSPWHIVEKHNCIKYKFKNSSNRSSQINLDKLSDIAIQRTAAVYVLLTVLTKVTWDGLYILWNTCYCQSR